MRRGITAGLATLALAGCSGGSDGGQAPPPVSGAPKQVVDAVMRLEAATRRGDYLAICDYLFTPSARRRAGGRDCAALLRSTGKDIRQPRLRLLSVRISGDRAQARVRTRAAGQGPVEETIELVRSGGRYRIEALAG